MAKTSKSSPDEYYLEKGISTVRRRIMCFGEIDIAMAEKVFMGLELLGRDSDAPIDIVLNSGGGDVSDGFAIYDAIVASPASVRIIGTGSVCSMAVFIMQAADQRYLTPNTTVMAHHGSCSTDSDAHSYAAWAEHSEKIRIEFNKILAKRAGRTEAFWNNKLRTDLVLTAAEAVKLGLADTVITSKDKLP